MSRPLRLYTVFHLNLAYSSIEIERYPEVIKQCYWPLLNLAEQRSVPIGIEATLYTLEQIERLDKRWLDKLRQLMEQGLCELIGSGDSQIIGPLVPAAVNQANLQLGMQGYEKLLNVQPRIALINEQAYADGLLALYREAGFSAVMMEWDNPAHRHPDWPGEWRYLPQRATSPDNGAELPLLWNHSIAFQKFQRYAHGDLVIEDYIDYLAAQIADVPRAMPLYGNDVEVFDFRPGRFHTEAQLSRESEWARIDTLFAALSSDARFELITPSRVLDLLDQPQAGNRLRLGDCAHPIPVKKQRKYNASRWAITGRDDLWLNTLCQRLYRRIAAQSGVTEEPALWRRLCRLWASDLRTHIATGRWEQAMAEAADFAGSLGVQMPMNTPFAAQTGTAPAVECIELDERRRYLHISTEHVRLTLNLRRGLALHRLAFAEQDFTPVVGTLKHGYFESIELGADFYTGGVVVELPGEHRRVADLEVVEPTLSVDGQVMVVGMVLRTSLGDIEKRWRIALDRAEITYAVAFPRWQRPLGTLRVGHITLLPEAFTNDLSLACRNGGEVLEHYKLDQDFWHTQPASTLVSASMGLGATDGELLIGNRARAIALHWDPSQCAAFPMVQHQCSRPGALTRVVFSLAELDETARSGGRLLPFELSLRPSRFE